MPGGVGGIADRDVRQFGCSEANLNIWKKRYDTLGMTEVKELRQLRDERARVQRLVADLTSDNILSEGVQKALQSTPRQSLANWMGEPFQIAVIARVSP